MKLRTFARRGWDEAVVLAVTRVVALCAFLRAGPLVLGHDGPAMLVTVRRRRLIRIRLTVDNRRRA